jgi:hypothetical protein
MLMRGKSKVLPTRWEGVAVESHFVFATGSTIDAHLDATVIVNRDSKRTVNYWFAQA